MKRPFPALLGVAALLLVALPAAAVTYGQPDGNAHKNVGALVGTDGGQPYAICSGALIASTIFLTAAHCGDADGERVQVTFDEDAADNPKLYAGTFHPDPRYTQAQSDPHDIAVVVLDRVIAGITPANLPTLGQFDNLKRPNGKNNPQFTAVGYGASEVTHGPGGHDFVYPDARMFAVGTLNAVNPAWLRISMNPARGNGGGCYGDSGGPNFVGTGNATSPGTVAAITITGDSVCRATNVVYRLDTKSAQGFLSDYVTLPTDRATKKRR